MNIILNGEINAKMVKHLASELNLSLELDSNKVDVFLTSDGGRSAETSIIIEMLNRHSKEVTLFAAGFNASSALEILTFFNGKKVVLPHANGMYHAYSEYMKFTSKGKLQDEKEAFDLEELKHAYMVGGIVCAYLQFTEEELELMDNGKDVYLSHKRLFEVVKSN